MKNKFKNEKLYKILKNYNVELLDDYVNNRIRQNYKCLKCGNIFESSLVIIQQGYKCRKCYPAKRRYPDSFKEQLDKLKIKLLDNSYINEKYLHNWKCLKCNSEFKEKWNRLRERKYNKCCDVKENNFYNDLKKLLIDYNLELSDNKYINAHFKHNWKCLKCGNKFLQTWDKIQQKQYKCRICFPKYKKSKEKFILTLNDQLKYLNLELIDIPYINCDYLHSWKCVKCGFEFKQIWDRIKQGKFIGCPKCCPRNKSISEKEIIEFLQNYSLSINENDRIEIQPNELDIFIPSKNIAIEFNGLYWHSELFKDKKYHINKTELCEKNNIRLIHIFEDEWIFKKDIIKFKLKQILSLNKNIELTHARKCEIKEISPKIKNKFLNKYHLQGEDKSNIKLGAFYNDELIAVMTFSHGDISRKKLNEYSWELSRFCSNYNYHIPGIASKILSYFKKNYSWKEIFSYADRRWSQGNLYYKIGFKLNSITKPNYYYIKGFNRIHRFNLRKKYHEPKNIPEWVLRQKEGYCRIWDCGHLKFIMENKNE